LSTSGQTAHRLGIDARFILSGGWSPTPELLPFLVILPSQGPALPERQNADRAASIPFHSPRHPSKFPAHPKCCNKRGIHGSDSFLHRRHCGRLCRVGDLAQPDQFRAARPGAASRCHASASVGGPPYKGIIPDTCKKNNRGPRPIPIWNERESARFSSFQSRESIGYP